MASSPVCSIPNCGKPAHCRGWCKQHYTRWRRHGDPLVCVPIGGGRPDVRDYLLTIALPFTGDECLIWPFARSDRGYAKARYDGEISASRALCRLKYGPPLGDANECAHSCNNGHLGCVNPNHLRWTTHQDNMDDRTRAGHVPHGPGHPKMKLTEEQVREIRLLLPTMTNWAISKRYSVQPNTIKSIRIGLSWAWLV